MFGLADASMTTPSLAETPSKLYEYLHSAALVTANSMNESAGAATDALARAAIEKTGRVRSNETFLFKVHRALPPELGKTKRITLLSLILPRFDSQTALTVGAVIKGTETGAEGKAASNEMPNG